MHSTFFRMTLAKIMLSSSLFYGLLCNGSIRTVFTSAQEVYCFIYKGKPKVYCYALQTMNEFIGPGCLLGRVQRITAKQVSDVHILHYPQ